MVGSWKVTWVLVRATPPSVVVDALEHDLPEVFAMSDETGQRTPRASNQTMLWMCMMMGQREAFRRNTKKFLLQQLRTRNVSVELQSLDGVDLREAFKMASCRREVSVSCEVVQGNVVKEMRNGGNCSSSSPE